MGLCYHCFQEKGRVTVCPFCAYDPTGAEEKYPLALKPGSILNGRYTVGRVLGQGGFGITYLAFDDRKKQRAAIKEYLPADFATRVPGNSSVQIYSGNRNEFFEFGKEQFLSEAKTLAEFIGDEHVVRIHRYFEENATAYFEMEYVDGLSLDKYMAEKCGRLSVGEAGLLLLPLMDSLGRVHEKGIIHRDVAPDNIIVEKSGNAKLIDFGAARYSTGEKSKSLDVVIKHGFAPREQYARHGRQGPFTDVYAMAATFYYVVTGRIPPDSIDRLDEDTLLAPSALGVRMSTEAEEVLFKALEVSYRDRYQTMSEFHRNLQAAISGDMEEELRERERKEREALEAAERAEQERKEREAREKEEKERKEKEAREEAERKEQERQEQLAREKVEQEEQKRKAREAKEEAARLKKEQRTQKTEEKKSGGMKSKAGIIGLVAVAVVAIVIGVIIGGRDTRPPSGAADTGFASSTAAPEPADTPKTSVAGGDAKTDNNLPEEDAIVTESLGTLTYKKAYSLKDFYPVLNESYGGYPVPTPDGSKRLTTVTMSVKQEKSSFYYNMVPVITDLLYDQSDGIIGQATRFGIFTENGTLKCDFDDKGRLIYVQSVSMGSVYYNYADDMLSYDFVAKVGENEHRGEFRLEDNLVTDRIRMTAENFPWSDLEYQEDGLLTKWTNQISKSCSYTYTCGADGTISKIEYSLYDTDTRLFEFDENGYLVSYTPVWGDKTFSYTYEDVDTYIHEESVQTAETESDLYWERLQEANSADWAIITDRLLVICNGQSIEAVLRNLQIKDNYIRNQEGNKNDLEYEWDVVFSDGNHDYTLGTTSWRFSPGKNEKITIDQMQHSLFIDGHLEADALMVHSKDSINWRVEIPDQFQLNWDKVKSYTVRTKNNDGRDEFTVSVG